MWLSLHPLYVPRYGKKINIDAKNIYQPRKNLGHFQSPVGTYKTQTEEIFKKVVEINKSITKSGASRNEARMLAKSFLSDTQLQKIRTKLTTLIFLYRYNRNIVYKI